MPDLHAFFINENATVRATLQTLDETGERIEVVPLLICHVGEVYKVSHKP